MRPYNLRWRATNRRKSALERLEKTIKKLSTSTDAKDSARLERSVEEAAILTKKISGGYDSR